jgi:hypothetical protein
LDDYKKQINDIFLQASGQTGNPQAKELYEDAARRLVSQYYSYGVTHADRQREIWQKDTDQNLLDTYRNNAVLASSNGNPAGVESALRTWI